MTTPAAILVLRNVVAFLLAGHAKFTIVSKVTGARKTFEIEKAPPKGNLPEAWFVRLLVGPDNGSDFRYIGTIRKGARLVFSPNSSGFGLEACAAIEWFLKLVNQGKDEAFNRQAEFWHSGFCSRCGRELTDPESIATGLGPVCRERVA